MVLDFDALIKKILWGVKREDCLRTNVRCMERCDVFLGVEIKLSVVDFFITRIKMKQQNIILMTLLDFDDQFI
jgi:hypothetical protein